MNLVTLEEYEETVSRLEAMLALDTGAPLSSGPILPLCLLLACKETKVYIVDSGTETRGSSVFTENFSREREREEEQKDLSPPRAVGYSAAGYFRVNRSSSGERVHGAVIAGLFLSFVDST